MAVPWNLYPTEGSNSMETATVKRLIPRKSSSLSLSSAYGFFIVTSVPVITFLAFLLVRQDSACREQTPTFHPSSDEATRGMICQIRLEETDRTPRLFVDIRNAGKFAFTGYMSTETNFAIRVDAKWYHWLGGVDVKGARWDPGSVYRNSVDLSDRSWGIDLSPGNHSVQAAFLLQKSHSWRCIWITSNILHATLAGR